MAAPWALLAASVLLSLLPFSTSDTPPPPSPPTRPPPGLPFVAINQIQGRSHYSPYNGMKVVTRGIVTGKSSTGFWMQTPDSEVDGDNATSEGIFVYRSSQAKPAVGDMVTMNGTVSEYYPAAGNLPLTELVSSSSTYKYVVLSSNNPLPTPVKLGEGGRPIPTEVIFDDRGFSVFDLARGADFYEAVEGMLIQVNQPFCVSGTSQYGEVVVLADGGRNTGSTLRSAHGGVVISATQFNPARIYLTDKLLFNASLGLAMPDCIVGDTLDSGLVTAIMDYQFNNYMAHITSGKPTIVRGSTVASVASVAAANEFTIGTFNMENFGGRAPQSKFDAIASQVVNNMRSPHILCAEEIQNTVFNTTNNTESDGVLDKLIAAIVAAGGPTTYVYRYIKPTVGTDGGEPGGDIRQVFIYQTDKVTFVDRPGGNATSNTSWALGADGTVELSASPGRLYPNDVAWTTSRKPLLGEFLVNGEKLLVVCNHFNSKGGDTSLYGTAQPPVLNSEVQRLKQAQIVNGFVTSVLSLDPAANVVVLGDLNDFSWSNPIQALKAGGVLLDLTEALLSPQERYSYVFDGNSQELDAILVSQHLFSRVSAVDVVHVNSEFPNTQQTSDHDPSVARIKYVTASGVPPPSPSLPPPSPPSPPPPSPPSLPPPSPPPVSTPPPPVVSTPPPPSPPTRPPPRSPPSSPSPRPPPRSPPPRPPLRPPPRPPRSPPPRPPPPSPPSPPPPPPTAVLASFTRFDKINLQAQILYDQGTQTADVCAVTCFADADCIAFVLSRTSAIVGTCTFMGSPVTKRRASSSVVTTFVKDPFSLYSAPLLDTGRYGGGNIVTLDAEGTGKPCAVQCVTDDTCAFVVYNPTDNTCSLKKSWSIAVRRPGQLMYKKL